MLKYFRFSEQQQFTLEDISNFNDQTASIRTPHRAYDQFRFVKNPFSPKTPDFLYGVAEDKKYLAQMLTMPMPLSMNNVEYPAFWGQDYFVLEDYRGRGIGKKLSEFYLKRDYYIAVGFSEKSALIHQKAGAKKIGYLDFYRKWKNPLSFGKSYFMKAFRIKPRAPETYQFPATVANFRKADTPDQLIFKHLNWNQEVVETLRNQEYFKWRFFYKPNRYQVYTSENKENPTYFVAKVCFYKGVNWLMIVDYRFDLGHLEQFKAMITASTKLRDQLKLSGVLFPSSLKYTKDDLEKRGFIRYKHEMVLTTFPFPWETGEEANNRFFISFADSDMDMHNYLGRFVFAD